MTDMKHIGARLRRLARHDGGTSLVEFAVVLPLFMMLIFGIMQLGQMLWTLVAMQHAVEMAARCASVNATTCGTASQIQTYAGTQAYGMTLPSGTFTATTPACGNKIVAAYTFQFQTALFSPMSVALSAQSCYPS